MPLSVTRTTVGGMRSTSASEVSRATSKGLQVAVVYADGLSAGLAETVKHAVELVGCVHFNQHVEREAFGHRGKVFHFSVGECGGDEQDGVGAVGARFNDLVLVDNEVLAQARERHGRRGEFEIAQAALEVGLVSQHGERRGAASAVASRDPCRVEVGAYQAFRG